MVARRVVTETKKMDEEDEPNLVEWECGQENSSFKGRLCSTSEV
jgi:hypothetical protein